MSYSHLSEVWGDMAVREQPSPKTVKVTNDTIIESRESEFSTNPMNSVAFDALLRDHGYIILIVISLFCIVILLLLVILTVLVVRV